MNFLDWLVTFCFLVVHPRTPAGDVLSKHGVSTPTSSSTALGFKNCFFLGFLDKIIGVLRGGGDSPKLP